MHLLVKSFTVQNDDSELAVVKTWKMCPQLNEHLLLHLPQVTTTFFAPSKQPTTSFKRSSRPQSFVTVDSKPSKMVSSFRSGVSYDVPPMPWCPSPHAKLQLHRT